MIEKEIYNYNGREGEKVPQSVTTLTVNHDVRELANGLCRGKRYLHQVFLGSGLESIGSHCFNWCALLTEIAIGSTVQFIGRSAFERCSKLKKVDFEDSASSPSQLQAIGGKAFYSCYSLPRIKLPSSVNSVGPHAFYSCSALVEANLSTTGLTEISVAAFYDCTSLQTASLPNTLEQLDQHSFGNCQDLVTVVVPLDSPPIRIGSESFAACKRLANLLLPDDSTASSRSWYGCEALQKIYGEDRSRFHAGLISRFEGLDAHKMCYNSPVTTTTVQELQSWVEGQDQLGLPVDSFGMTPLHVLFSKVEPSVKLLQVILDHYPYHQIILDGKQEDVNGKRAFDYLINNWTSTSATLLERTLQQCILDPLARWGATMWVEPMEHKVKALLLTAEYHKAQRMALFNEISCGFGKYEKMESTSILEIALWKATLKSGQIIQQDDDSSKRRAECRCTCGADAVLPNVVPFLWG